MPAGKEAEVLEEVAVLTDAAVRSHVYAIRWTEGWRRSTAYFYAPVNDGERVSTRRPASA